MNATEQSRLVRSLRDRRGTIARNWYAAIARSGFTSLTTAEVSRNLEELTDRIVTLLFSKTFERNQAREVGASLGDMHYISPEALSGTQEVLARRLLEGLPVDQAVALQPRLTALLSCVAAGFSERARDQILSEQEEARAALLSERDRAEEALRPALGRGAKSAVSSAGRVVGGAEPRDGSRLRRASRRSGSIPLDAPRGGRNGTDACLAKGADQRPAPLGGPKRLGEPGSKR
jgi:hypothetical protein